MGTPVVMTFPPVPNPANVKSRSPGALGAPGAAQAELTNVSRTTIKANEIRNRRDMIYLTAALRCSEDRYDTA
jgi:hypothetical protein